MSLRLPRLHATAVVLPRVVSFAPLACVAAVGVVVVGFTTGGDGALVSRTRMAAMLVAATSAALLDDAAAVTLAPSPTPLVARRSFRIAIIGALVATWWSLTLVIASLRTTDLPAAALTREVIVLTAIAIVGALAAQRWSTDGQGGSAGGLAAIGWFVLSFLPRVRRVPLPPNALDPQSTGQLTAVTIVAVVAALALSRDPAARWRPR